MSRRKIIIVAVLVLVAVGAMLILNRDPRNSGPTPSPSIAVTVTPDANTTLLEQYSRDFSSRYYTYTRLDDPAYLNSIKSYLEQPLFARITEENRKLGTRAKPVRSTIKGVALKTTAADRIEIEVTVQSEEQGFDPYEKVSRLIWVKQGERWVISRIDSVSTTKRYKYLES